MVVISGNVPRITPEQAKEILRKEGRDVDIREAKLILDLLYNFANIAIDNYLESEAKISENPESGYLQ